MCPTWCQQIENEQYLLKCTDQALQDHNKALKKTINNEMTILQLDLYLREKISNICWKK